MPAIQMPVEKEARAAVGIDLGTTYSLVALVDPEGSVRVLPDSEGKMLLPSVVRYFPGGLVVGEKTVDSVDTIVSSKRLMGRSLAEVQHLPYRFVATNSAVPTLHVADRQVTSMEVAAEILKSLWTRAQAVESRPLVGAVITVPAYFDEAARQATLDAATLAGVPVLRLLSEPTAAAVAYGHDRTAFGHYLIYDLGGGTFDVSILRLEKGVFEVLSTAGDTALGGDDIDAAVVAWFREKGQTITRQEAQALKEALSSTEKIEKTGLCFSADDLEAIARPWIEKTLEICTKALEDSGLSQADLNAMILVGGSTRLRALNTRLDQWFQGPIERDLDPDKVVAIGAAYQADALAGNRQDDPLLLLDMIPLSIGMEVMGGVHEKMFLRHTRIPASTTQVFTTYQDNQTAMRLHIVQGERELVKDCRSLSQFSLKGIPPLPAGEARISVTFDLDADGLLRVSAKELLSGVHAEVAVKPTYGLDEAQLSALLQDAAVHAQSDVLARQFESARVSGSQYLDVFRAGYLPLDSAQEKAIADFELAVAAKDAAQVQRAVDALEALVQPHLEARLKRALHLVMKDNSNA